MPEALAVSLRGHGFDAVTTTQLGRKGSSDPRQLKYASETARVLVTHNNRDYRMLHEALVLWAEEWGVLDRRRHSGILIIDQGPQQRGGSDIAVLTGIGLQVATLGPMENRLFAWNPRVGRHEAG
jgi:hypothetical protein